VANSADGLTSFADVNATEVDPATWRLLTLSAGHWQIRTLQPVEWIEVHGLTPGLTSRLNDYLDLSEMGAPDDLVGTIDAISASPPIEGGYGRVVLTTVSHLNDSVFDLSLRGNDGELNTIGVMGVHKIYSDDLGWVSAQDLRPGEAVRTAEGLATVAGLVSRTGVHRVYNMTVEADHMYYVGDLSALVHNWCDATIT
jgi:hypothetical protein